MPLSGISILDLSRGLPGSMASQLLADFGAQVIKVEDLHGGDPTRKSDPPVFGNESVVFYAVNRNKKSIAIDMRREEGKLLFKRMVGRSDILIETFKPGTMAKWGLDYDKLKEINSGLIYCALSAFGSTGPLSQIPGHDLNILSFSGITHLNGKADNAPVISPIYIAANSGSLYATTAILMALFNRQKTGLGQLCDISLLDASISLMSFALANWSGEEKVPERGYGQNTGSYAYYQIYGTKDGKYMSLAAAEAKYWQLFCQRINLPQYIAWHKNPDKKAQRELAEVIGNVIAQKTQQEWVDIFADVDLCFTPVLDLEAMSEHPQVKARDMFVSFNDFDGGGKALKLAGLPIKLSATPGNLKINYPRLGEHTREILLEIGLSNDEIANLAANKVII